MRTLRGGVPIVLRPATDPGVELWPKVYAFGTPQFATTLAIDEVDGHWWFFGIAEPSDPAAIPSADPRYEGHWRQTLESESELPWPTPEPGWDPEAFLVVLDTVESQAVRIAYRGISNCRLCGRPNGHEGLRFRGWEWPAGFRHYVAEHSIRPSQEFIGFVTEAESGGVRQTDRSPRPE